MFSDGNIIKTQDQEGFDRFAENLTELEREIWYREQTPKNIKSIWSKMYRKQAIKTFGFGKKA